MKIKITLLIISGFFVPLFVSPAFALDIEYVGRVENLSASTLGSKVVFKDSVSQNVILTKDIDPSGAYAVSLPQGTYDIAIIPPTQSGLKSITKSNQKIMSNSESTFTLPSSSKPLYTGLKDINMYIVIVGIIIMLSAVIWYFFRKTRS